MKLLTAFATTIVVCLIPTVAKANSCEYKTEIDHYAQQYLSNWVSLQEMRQIQSEISYSSPLYNLSESLARLSEISVNEGQAMLFAYSEYSTNCKNYVRQSLQHYTEIGRQQ